MPTYDTANSSGTYDPPDSLDEFKVVVVGGWGGDADGAQTYTGGARGPGRKIEAIITHSASDGSNSDTYDVFVGEAGTDGSNYGDDDGTTPPAGSSPVDGGVSGGEGTVYNTALTGTEYVHPGGGGAPSALRISGNSAYLVLCEGGGGAGAGSGNDKNSGGGGGGARGGVSGDPNPNGTDADGTGDGGHGGDGTVGNAADGQDGFAGGYTTDGGITVQTNTTTTTESPIVQIVDKPRNLSIQVTNHTDTSVSIEVDADNNEFWTIHRSTSSGFTPDAGNQVDDFSAGGLHNYQDTGLTQGTTYYYKAVASNAAGDSTTPKVTQTTDAPSPTLDAFDAVDDAGDGTADQLEYQWTRGGTDETAYRVLYSTDGGSTWTQANGDRAGTATSYITADRSDGTDHIGKVEAVYNDVTRESGTLTTTTELPDVATGDITPIDASVENELTVPNANVADTGIVRYQIRVSGSGNAYDDDIGVVQGGADVTFDNANANILDGEKYDVRARSETPDVIGAWVSVSEITKLPADTNLTNTDRIA